MSRRKIKAGSTSITMPIFIQDTTSTSGGGLGSLVYNSAGLAAKYRRQGDNAWTTIVLATATVGTFTSGGFISDGGPVTGTYEVGIPDGALASGARWVEIVYYGATNMLPVLVEFELDAIDYQTSIDAAVWNANPNTYSGLNTFGYQLQPIYYADVKQYYNIEQSRDEYGVDWYRGNQFLGSGSVTEGRMSVYSTTDGSIVFQNSGIYYQNVNNGSMKYNSYATLTPGTPYNVMVSGVIDGSLRIWQKVIGRSRLS